jgi:prepilin-type N-terminal cleavage/methylation domain-containing protein
MIKVSSKSGFSMMEVTIAIIVLGVIAAMAIPSFTKVVEKSRASEGEKMLKYIYDAQGRYHLENSAYTADEAALDMTISNMSNFSSWEALVPADADDPKYIGRLTRNTNDYRLYIDDTESFHCEGLTVKGDAICGYLGHTIVP